MNEQTIPRTDAGLGPVLLTPALIVKMLARREVARVMKFRAAGTALAPNY
ncbi:MAG TPA: hypothetical protein VFQ44_22105 [Streptosporangiaceae bacterium]|nr:hypothetical protein [Streptosporangiaceae bacterium]